MFVRTLLFIVCIATLNRALDTDWTQPNAAFSRKFSENETDFSVYIQSASVSGYAQSTTGREKKNVE